ARHGGPGGPGGGAAAAVSRGPIGWDTYRRLDRLPDLTAGVATKQFSGFDRSGGNGDFSHCLTQAADGCVIAQASGAGEVDSIWFTRDGGDVTTTGNITVTLDGTTVLHGKLQDIVKGSLGSPFVYPLVANADESSGGDYILVPMPYHSSMRITTDVDPIYYHVTYRTFASGDGVSTFDPSDPAADVVAKLRAAGTADPKPVAPRTTTTTRPVRLAPGASATLATEHTAGALSAVSVHLPQLAVATGRQVTDDGRAYGTNGYDQFTVAIDPANTGVRLTRRLDPEIGNQRSQVLVDGVHVADWAGLPARPAGQWADESVDLPASATAGKSQITIKDAFTSSDLDINAFTYWVDSAVNGTYTRTDTVDVGPDHIAAEQAHQYTIVSQTFQGTRTFRYPPTAAEQQAAGASTAILAGTRLRIAFDGKTQVDAPIGQFFGSGLGGYQVDALMSSVDETAKTLTAWWPMPYASRATVTLTNGSDVAITGAGSSVTASRDRHWARALATGQAAYFHATTNAGTTRSGQDYPFLRATGRGKFVGVSHTMRGPSSRGYLEGDERVYVDGSSTPQIHGTGTEDFYEGGWYFNRDTFSDPMNGESGHEPGTGGCRADEDCTSTYREMLADAVPFGSSIDFGIEHGGVDDVTADYASTAFWYGMAGNGQRFTDAVDVGAPASERAHHLTGGGDVSTLTDTYEGNNAAPQPVTDDLRSGAVASSFQLAVDPKNGGVILHRQSDQRNAYQSADVTINGKAAGTWLQPLGNGYHRWLDDSFALPASLTAGQRSIDVRITPTAGAPAWTAARYAAVSVVAPFRDHTRPGAVAGLTATSGASNEIDLSWRPAIDDVYQPSYRVYASTSRGFRAGPSTVVGSTSTSSFADTGLGLRQTWYFRVQAVDAAGNAGPLSPQVSARTGTTMRVEAETLLPPVDATAPVVAQGDCCGISWSGGQQLWFQPTTTGQHVTLALQIPQGGTYDLAAVQTQAPDYGVNILALDGAAVGTAQDAYHPGGVVVTAPIDYGTHQLTAGRHLLTLTVTGKNAAAAGYLAGLDYLQLTLSG
ncbi:MAG: DUF2961 domain-containing protein, partial [Mycobacteriales bacterium]